MEEKVKHPTKIAFYCDTLQNYVIKEFDDWKIEAKVEIDGDWVDEITYDFQCDCGQSHKIFLRGGNNVA